MVEAWLSRQPAHILHPLGHSRSPSSPMLPKDMPSGFKTAFQSNLASTADFCAEKDLFKTKVKCCSSTIDHVLALCSRPAELLAAGRTIGALEAELDRFLLKWKT